MAHRYDRKMWQRRAIWLASESALCPSPVANFRQVFAVFCYIQTVALNGLGVPLPGVLYLRSKARDARDGVERQLEAVNIVEHAHVEGRGRCALFLVAAHVKVIVVVTPVGEPVNEPRIAVKCKDGGRIRWKDAIELLVGQPVRMFGLRLKSHEVNHVYHADAQVRNPGAQQRNGGQRFQRRYVATAGHDDVWLAVVI